MPKFTIQFKDGSRSLEFEADTPASAISKLEKEGAPRDITIFKGDQLVAELSLDGSGVWHLNEKHLTTFGA